MRVTMEETLILQETSYDEIILHQFMFSNAVLLNWGWAGSLEIAHFNRSTWSKFYRFNYYVYVTQNALQKEVLANYCNESAFYRKKVLYWHLEYNSY